MGITELIIMAILALSPGDKPKLPDGTPPVVITNVEPPLKDYPPNPK